MADDQKIVFSRVFDAPREKVWEAWTDPEIAKKWWGPKDFTAPSMKIDLKVGGKYIYCMHGPAGTDFDKDMYSAGEFKEIVPNEKLVVTDYFSDENGNLVDPTTYGMGENFPKESIVTVTFEEVDDNKTKLSIIYMPESEAAAEAMKKTGMDEGWNQTLDKLAEVLR